MQMLADVCELHAERTESVEMSVLGAAMLAKLGLELDGARLSEAQLRERIDSVALLARRVRGDLTLFHPRTLTTLTPAAHSHSAARRTDTATATACEAKAAAEVEQSEELVGGDKRSGGGDAGEAGETAPGATEACELRTRYGEAYARWLRAVDRSRNWHLSRAANSGKTTRSTSRSSSVLAVSSAEHSNNKAHPE